MVLIATTVVPIATTVVLALDAPFSTEMQLAEPTRLAGPSTLTLAHVAHLASINVTSADAHAAPTATTPPVADAPSTIEGSITFAAKGEAGAYVTGSVAGADVQFHVVDAEGNHLHFPVIQWRLGGDMDASGVARFDASGMLSNLEVGAATLSPAFVVAEYSGSATFRLAYQ